jgi:type II secretory pathway pseudopilin PulG
MRRRMGRPGLIGTVARTAVIAGTATAVSGSVSRRGQQRAEEQQQAAAYQQQAQQGAASQAVPPQAGSPADRIAQLKELGELKSQGVLSDDEFAAEKARILAS